MHVCMYMSHARTPPQSNTLRSYGLLEHNVAAMGLGGRVSTHHGDFLKLLPELRQDVVFLDPPWVRKGGR